MVTEGESLLDPKAPISVLALGTVVVLFAFAWYVLFLFLETDITLKAIATPFFLAHAALGIGLLKGWGWARWGVIGVAVFGLIASLILIVFRGMTDLFMGYLLVLFLAAIIILLREPARTYCRT